MKNMTYRLLTPQKGGFYLVLFMATVVIGLALFSAWYMEHNGHWVTGMNNQIVWGMPHVFAIFLIVAASGALNVASIGTVFGRKAYKPLARLSGVLAVSLLIGGLAVLVLDLGRPDRLIIAMTHMNYSSIFAWNILLYSGFVLIVGVYIWTQMDRLMEGWKGVAGIAAFIWRLVLTTGTGLIFGFLVAREAYDAAVLAPLFIAMSFALGLAVFVLVLSALGEWCDVPISDHLIARMGRLLGIFVVASLYFTVVQHLTGLYAAEHTAVERFVLLDGGVITILFWVGQIAIGSLLPLALIFGSKADLKRGGLMLCAFLVVIGGFAQLYVIIIGGQAFPLVLFPGMEVSSSFYDGAYNTYSPSLPEVGLGVGGFAIAMGIAMVCMRVLRFIPVTLENSGADSEHSKP